jgi:hypothetical protein
MARITFWEPRGKLTPELIRDVLMLISLDVDLDTIKTWTPNELLMVYDWAMREHARASDNIVRRRPRPALLAVARPIDPTLYDPENLFPRSN